MGLQKENCRGHRSNDFDLSQDFVDDNGLEAVAIGVSEIANQSESSCQNPIVSL